MRMILQFNQSINWLVKLGNIICMILGGMSRERRTDVLNYGEYK